MTDETFVLEIVILSTEDGFRVAMRSDDGIIGQSVLFSDKDTATMLASEMERRARKIASDYIARSRTL